MKRIVLYALLFINGSVPGQEINLPNQITLWNPNDLKFTQDNKYLVATSPNDSKVWNLENLECLNVKTDFYGDVLATDNCWSYLYDANSFFFHRSGVGNEVYKVDPEGKNWKVESVLGKGDYCSYQFDEPPCYFLNSNTFLIVHRDKKYLPYISVQQLGKPKELIHEKIEGKNTMNVSNRNFSVLKGNDNLYYLLSFRSSYQQDNSEGVVTEINLDTHKTRVLASGIMVYTGDNAQTNTRIETLKRSIETPGFIILDLDGFLYAIRKSDGKILANNDLKSKFPENSYPKICGERDGKLIVYSFDLGIKKGFAFHTIDFETQIVEEQIFHFGIDLMAMKGFKIAVSRNGREIAIAYKWDEDHGYKVAYIDAKKMTMLRDKNNTVEKFLTEQVEIKKANQIAEQNKQDAQQNKISELQGKSIAEMISREWYAIIEKPNDRSGIGLQLYCDNSGNITGYYEFQQVVTSKGFDASLSSTTNYSVIFKVTGHTVNQNTFVFTINELYSKNVDFDESKLKGKTLTFEIQINSETRDSYVVYCKEYQGNFREGNLDKHFFNR